MNRNNVLEKHLLSRSYDSESRIEELLNERYSLRGTQRHFMHIVPTISAEEKKGPIKILNHGEVSEPNAKVTKERRVNTRRELRLYIQSTLANQTKLIKKIQAYNRMNKERNDSNRKKPFPVIKLIDHYKIPKFEDFKPINNLWQNYIQDLLFPQQVNSLPGSQALLQKLSLADFNGCLLHVIDSKNKNCIGIRGIVAWDTQYSFILCTPRNEDSKEWNGSRSEFTPAEQVGGLRIISKKGTLFGFDIELPSKLQSEGGNEETLGFTIIGSRFEFRSVDRSGKKFKNHNVDDLV